VSPDLSRPAASLFDLALLVQSFRLHHNLAVLADGFRPRLPANVTIMPFLERPRFLGLLFWLSHDVNPPFLNWISNGNAKTCLKEKNRKSRIEKALQRERNVTRAAAGSFRNRTAPPICRERHH
jgi:hypothetical protein